MLFDRFSFRERESGMPDEDPVVGDLPSESRSYSFNLDSRQMMFLIAGYCFLCVLVFALGMVVGRATTTPDTVAETENTVASLPREQATTPRPDLASGSRIPLMPPAEPKSQAVQGPEYSFSPTLPQTPALEKLDSAAPPAARPKPAPTAPTPEVTRAPEPPAVTPKAEEKREVEPRRPVATAETKPKAPAATRVSLNQSGDYTIQVSSFRSMDQASELKGRLSKKGYAAYVQSVDLSDKGMWHRVRIGNYRDKDGAERVASDLRNRESLPATVMKR